MTDLAPIPSVAAPRAALPHPTFRVAELRVKVRSLADEARVIRHEEARAKLAARCCSDAENKARHRRTLDSLHLHRVGVVRGAARTAQLAMAFLRGLPYRVVEAKVRPWNEPDVEAIQRTVVRFGGSGGVAEWVAI